MTGFLKQVNQISKRAELLRSFCPSVQRVGVVAGVDSASDVVFLDNLAKENNKMRRRGMVAVPLYLRIDEFPKLPALILENNLDALAIVFNLDVKTNFLQVRAVVEALHIPHIHSDVRAVQDGGAFAAQPVGFDFVKSGAEYIARIARGEKPGDIPIQISRAYDIVVNTDLIQKFKGCDPRRIARIATKFYP